MLLREKYGLWTDQVLTIVVLDVAKIRKKGHANS
jgi:hypothetical protein